MNTITEHIGTEQLKWYGDLKRTERLFKQHKSFHRDEGRRKDQERVGQGVLEIMEERRLQVNLQQRDLYEVIGVDDRIILERSIHK